MYRMISLHIILLLGATASAQQPQWRCDCTTVLDSCSATVTVREHWIDITTDHQQCARVDYFIDGIPFVTTVVEGTDRQDWLARTESTDIFVQSCQVCQDNSIPATASQAAPTPSPAPGVQPALEPLITVDPVYPTDARARGIEGGVTVEFSVTELGHVEDVRVVRSTPAGVFDSATVSAVQRWRYPPGVGRQPIAVTEELGFSIADTILRLEAPSRAAMTRNDCVRESVSYDFGEMVEVGLINACAEPLMVFGCAHGTAQHSGQWVCVDSERLQSVLLRPGDGRIGSSAIITTDGVMRSFSYAENIFVARAPNTQYWWIACRDSDIACRDSARRWVQAVDRQLASVDPQARASVLVARSQ